MRVKPAHLVLFVAFVVLLFNSGARFAMGLMLRPMADDLGWSRTTLSSTVTLFMVISASALPFAGRLVDRLGPLRVLLAGVVVSGIAIGAMGFIRAPLEALVLYGCVFALGSAATSITPIGVLVTRWFPHRVGIANSAAIAGMGVGQLLIIAGLASQLARIGWRGSYAALGGATIAVVVPLIWWLSRVLRGPASGSGPQPDASPASTRVDAPSGPERLRDALRGGPVWIVLALYAVCGFQDFFVATHVVAFALDEGVEALLAGNMLAFMGLAGLAGVLVSGALNDRFGPALPTAICFSVRIIVFAVVLVSRDPPIIIAVALFYGMTFWITAPLAVVFARRYCGFALLGTVSGVITMVHQVNGGAGAYFGAWVFDSSGSYDRALEAMLILSIVGLGLTFFTRGDSRKPGPA